MKKVLVISYYWPPSGGPGVQRVLKFTKYLRQFGWEPVVLTVENGSFPSMDHSLAKDIPENLSVFKAPAKEPFKLYNSLRGKKGKSVPVAMAGIRDSKSWFQRLAMWVRANLFIPDARIGWKKAAVKKALEVISTEDISAIITSSPPHSSQLIGLEVHRMTGIPWIADLRDPWTNVFLNEYLPRTEGTKRKDKKLEDAVVSSANAVTVISEGMKAEFSDRNKEIHVIYNGFDADDILDMELKATPRFQVAYIGNYKPNQNVPELWKAVRRLNDEIPELTDDMELQFIGNIDDHIAASFAEEGIADVVKISGFIPHLEAVRKMQDSNVLLFVIPNSKDSRYILTGKIFEYLASKTRLLSIGPVDGNAASILKDAGRHDMIDYADSNSMYEQLKESYLQWKQSGLVPKYTNDQYLQFSRKDQTEKLAALLNNITHAGH